MTINFDEAKVLTLVKTFNGTTEDGRKFTITAEWNDFDDWTVDSIEWEGEEGTEEEIQEIEELFLNEMN
jgi:hypothetical protein